MNGYCDWDLTFHFYFLIIALQNAYAVVGTVFTQHVTDCLAHILEEV